MPVCQRLLLAVPTWWGCASAITDTVPDTIPDTIPDTSAPQRTKPICRSTLVCEPVLQRLAILVDQRNGWARSGHPEADAERPIGLLDRREVEDS